MHSAGVSEAIPTITAACAAGPLITTPTKNTGIATYAEQRPTCNCLRSHCVVARRPSKAKTIKRAASMVAPNSQREWEIPRGKLILNGEHCPRQSGHRGRESEGGPVKAG